MGRATRDQAIYRDRYGQPRTSYRSELVNKDIAVIRESFPVLDELAGPFLDRLVEIFPADSDGQFSVELFRALEKAVTHRPR